jgi:tetratricopeptide (TPR) repeat protein
MDGPAKSEIHNNLGWVYIQKKLYDNAKDEFLKARTIDPKNVKAIRNLRALNNIEPSLEIAREHIAIAALLIIPLSFSIYLF